MLLKWVKNMGPGPLIAAAFIGPGTVTVCTLAGVHFGYALLWAMGLSVLATIFLQEMTARLGIVTQKGLAENLRGTLEHPLLRSGMLVLVFAAIVVGNAAYEAGNISGGVLGLEALVGSWQMDFWGMSINLYSLLLGMMAFVLLYTGSYKVLERVLIGLVMLMSVAFLTTTILLSPNLLEIGKGLFGMQLPEQSILTVIALVGTTVVPYNLFLHAALVKEKWHGLDKLTDAKRDTIWAVVLGGIVSMSIMVTAASTPLTEVAHAADLARGLEPLFGSFATYFLSIGLFAAGITSAITAPLAAAFVAKGCFGWSGGMQSKKFRMVWGLVLAMGVLLSSIGVKPIEIIKFAQVANGLLLPLIAGLLLWIMNKKGVLGTHSNSHIQNVVGGCIVLIALVLGLKSILAAFAIL